MKRALACLLLLICAPTFAASYADDFDRANENPLVSPPWTTLGGGGFLVVSNAARPSGGANQFSVYDDTFSDDQFSRVTLGNISASGQVGPGVRMSSAGGYTGYNLYIGAGGSGWTLQEAPGFSTILSGATTFTTGDVVELQIVGTTLTVKKNGATLDTVTDATITSGQAGLIAYGGETDADFTEWEGGDVAAPSGGLLLRRRR